MTHRRGTYRNPPAISIGWQERAACRGSSVNFIPDDKDAQTELAAKTICLACPVKAQCLAFALRLKDPGIWGAMTLRERESMKRRLSTG